MDVDETFIVVVTVTHLQCNMPLRFDNNKQKVFIKNKFKIIHFESNPTQLLKTCLALPLTSSEGHNLTIDHIFTKFHYGLGILKTFFRVRRLYFTYSNGNYLRNSCKT